MLVLGIIILGIAACFLAAAILCWLWNTTMPDVFELKKITYWQAFRLLLLAMILFGGIRFGIGK